MALRREVEELLRAAESPGFFDSLVPDEAQDAVPLGRGPQLHSPGARVGPYEIEGILGRGGMGVVYAARRVEGGFEQEVALKVLPSDLVSGRVEERLKTERQILARLSHPNVARLLDGGVDGEGRPWFAMERVRGETLPDYCDGGRLDVPTRLDLFGAVCDAVQHAHENLVVHRDLKPNNILVDEDGVPKLLDFGIAKFLDPDAAGAEAFRTRVGLKVFTPAYAAPEQRRGEPVTTATDVYQLGILLYELLTGVHPFPDRSEADARSSGASTRNRDPDPPSTASTGVDHAQTRSSTPSALRQRLKGDLDAIVLKALREDPAERYRTVTELTDDLARYRTRRPVRARAQSWAYRSGRFLRRNALVVGASAAAVTAMVAFSAGIAREARRTALERDRVQAVNDFVEELFAAASPHADGGEPITARDLLDGGAERIRERLSDQPVVQATLMDVIADAYFDLGAVEEALTLRTGALELWRDQARPGGVHGGDLVFSLAEVGSLLAQKGEMEASRALLEEAETLLDSHVAEPDRRRASALNSVGFGWQMHGDYDRAEPRLEQAVAAFRRVQSGDLTAAAALGNLAYLRQERGDLDSARVLFEAALEMRRSTLGPDHLLVANTLAGLGDLAEQEGRLAAADSAYREALRIRSAGLPEDHYLIHMLDLGLAQVVARAGDPARADTLFRSAIDGLVRGMGSASPTIPDALNEYGIFLQSRGRTGEAAATFARARVESEEIYGVDHLRPAVIRANHAWALYLSGRTDEAVAAFEEVLPVLRRRGRFHDNQAYYGVVLCATDRRAAAVGALEEAVAGLEAEGLDEDRLLWARNALGQCLLSDGRPGEAERVLQEVIRATEARPDGDPYRAFAEQMLADVR